LCHGKVEVLNEKGDMGWWYKKIATHVTPARARFRGKWKKSNQKRKHKSNIFPEALGVLEIEADCMKIPVGDSTNEQLQFYGARLLRDGDVFCLSEKVDLPLFEVEIGKEYVKEYMMKEKGAGGIYMEYHDAPHLHIASRKEHSSGWLVLGKEHDGNFELSAFQIPRNCAIYTHPLTLHNDCFLVGKYNVAFTDVANDTSTVRILSSNGQKVEISIA